MSIERKIQSYNATLGMRVYHERTLDWDVMTLVHHIELAMPGYELTPNGPEWIDINELELDDAEE